MQTPRAPDSGVYVGEGDNFEDIVNFWNLRAAGAGLIFYDPKHADRLTALLDAHRRWLGSMPARSWQPDGAISIYRREEQRKVPVPAELGSVLQHGVSAPSRNAPILGYGLKQDLADEAAAESFHRLMLQMIGVHALQDRRFREVYETKPLQILGILRFGDIRA